MATPSDDPTFELIENVQDEQCLWDRGDELFKDAKYKKAVWADIASKVGYASGDKARSRWESVRDEYVKKKKAAPSGSAGGKKPAWKYWDQMQFLDGVLEPRPGHSSTLDQDPAVENDDTDELASNTDSSRIPPSPAASTTSVSQKRRRSNLEQVEKKKLLEGLKETEKQMKLARMEEDSDGMVFGRSVGKSLEKLDTGQAEWAKMHIQQVLFNARFIGPHAQKPQYTQPVPLQQFYGGMQPIHHHADDVNAEDHLGAKAAFRLYGHLKILSFFAQHQWTILDVYVRPEENDAFLVFDTLAEAVDFKHRVDKTKQRLLEKEWTDIPFIQRKVEQVGRRRDEVEMREKLAYGTLKVDFCRLPTGYKLRRSSQWGAEAQRKREERQLKLDRAMSFNASLPSASTSKDAKDDTNSLYDDDDLFEAALKLLPNDIPPDTSSETAKVETDSLYDGDEQFEAAFKDIL